MKRNKYRVETTVRITRIEVQETPGGEYESYTNDSMSFSDTQTIDRNWTDAVTLVGRIQDMLTEHMS